MVPVQGVCWMSKFTDYDLLTINVMINVCFMTLMLN